MLVEGFSEQGTVVTVPVPEMLSDLSAEARETFDEAVGGGDWLTDAELVGQVRGLQVVLGSAHAAQVVRIAQFAARTIEEMDAGLERVDRGVGFVDEFASDTLAPVLGMTHGPAATRVRTAAKLAADLPVTLGRLAAGDLDLFRAQVIADELAEADHDTCAVIEERIFPWAVTKTPGRIRSRIRKELADLDPDAVKQRAARARLERFVSTRASHLPGMTQWLAQLPAAESAQAWAAIDALAHQHQQNDPQRTIDQCRADALLDLILGHATVKAVLTLSVPATNVESYTDTDTETNAGTDTDADINADADAGTGAAGDAQGGADSDGHLEVVPVPEEFGGSGSGSGPGAQCGPAGSVWEQIWPHLAPSDPDGVGVEVPGIGVIPVPLVLSMAADLGVSITRMLIDPQTGTTVETKATGYRPPAGIARFVRLRDGACRFPNCSRRAERCDIDHVVPWPAGPTAASNLICLCRHHHRLKHATAWRPELLKDGPVIWTDPFGQDWVTYPADHRETSAA